MTYLTDALLIVAAYLIGSISFAIIVSKLYGLPDPRTRHSGNPGGTNVMRMGGYQPGLLTVVGDFLKAFIPVLVAAAVLTKESHTVGLVAFGSFLGHLFPIYHQFRGGKGVATFWGGLSALSTWGGFTYALLWITILALFRWVAMASILAGIVTPFLVWWFTQSVFLTGVFVLMSLIIVWKHRENIQRIRHGTEDKFGE